MSDNGGFSYHSMSKLYQNISKTSMATPHLFCRVCSRGTQLTLRHVVIAIVLVGVWLGTHVNWNIDSLSVRQEMIDHFQMFSLISFFSCCYVFSKVMWRRFNDVRTSADTGMSTKLRVIWHLMISNTFSLTSSQPLKCPTRSHVIMCHFGR